MKDLVTMFKDNMVGYRLIRGWNMIREHHIIEGTGHSGRTSLYYSFGKRKEPSIYAVIDKYSVRALMCLRQIINELT